MKDIQPMLRRIDEEITGHRQNIAYRQVEIARLEDTRKVLMGIAESDIEHEASRAEERKVLTNGAGAHAKPILIVRKTGSGGEKVKHRRGVPGASSNMRPKIIELLTGAEPMTSLEIGNRLGVKPDQASRKPMSNALYQLLIKGVLTRSEGNDTRTRRYSLTASR